jgi:LacI family transcriptional regulator
MDFTQVTIKDIARELGISPSTVSRALKDHPDISRETKKAVTDLANKLNYQPNIVALNLRTKKTHTIGVVIPELVHFFFSTVISGIEAAAYEAGYNVILSQSNESFEREVNNFRTLSNLRVDGMLISLSRETANFEHIETTINRGTPIVFYDRTYHNPECNSVTVDDYVGAKEAVQHLISSGCKNIAHISAAHKTKIALERLSGYKDALSENGIQVDENLIIRCEDGNVPDGKLAMQELFKRGLQPDAVFTNNDLLAMGAMNIIKANGYKIPEDIAVVGFSNWAYSELMEPPLSSVHQPGFEMGQEATRMLIKLIELKDKRVEGIKPDSKILKTKLIIRSSSDRKTA